MRTAHRALGGLVAALFACVTLSAACGGEKKKTKPKELKITDLSVKFHNDLARRYTGPPKGTNMKKVKGPKKAWFAKPTSIITVKYDVKNVKLQGGMPQLKQTWKLRDSKGMVVWKHTVTESKSDADNVDGTNFIVKKKNVHIGELIKAGKYTFEVRVSDSLGNAVANAKTKTRRDASLEVKTIAKPKDALALPDTGLYILAGKEAKVPQNGTDIARDTVELKKGKLTVEIAMDKPSKAMVASKLARVKEKDKKGKEVPVYTVRESSSGTGEEFFINYDRQRIGSKKKKKKRTYKYWQHLKRRGALWACKGETNNKKLAKQFKALCESLK